MMQVKLELVISDKKPHTSDTLLPNDSVIWPNHYAHISGEPNPTVIPIDNYINRLHKISATLLPNGKWKVITTSTSGRKSSIPGERDIIEIFEAFSDILQFDIQNPHASSCPECICPKECDCQAPEDGLVSNHCPIHNEEPEPYPDCPQHNMISDIL